MKKLLLLLLCLPMIGFGQLTYVPDDNFEAYLESNGMGNEIPNDDHVATGNINTVDSLTVDSLNIADLTGIEDFIALTYLNCAGNSLTNLDVSQNAALYYLSCFDNQLTSLDISNNTALIELRCGLNQLQSLDLSQNTALTNLNCQYNQLLTSLDVSNNIALTELRCRLNQLTSLDVSNNTALTYLDCSTNLYGGLTSLDVSQNTALTYLSCENHLLTSLDVSNNTALTYLSCVNNQLPWVDVSTNTALTDLFCGYNQLQSLDLSQNTALTSLVCWFNELTSLDVSNNASLTYLNCTDNRLTSLDVSNNTALTILECSDNSDYYNQQLTSLDVSNNTALTHLGCSHNQLTTLDVSNNAVLQTLYCQTNQLTSLDVSNNTALTHLHCHTNQLTSLDIRNGNNINMIGVSIISFTALNNPNLYCIDVDNAAWSTANWTNIDFGTSFSENCSLAGCVDSLACNYNSLAWIDDGSCILPDGCTDPVACNYDVNAICDDGSCLTIYGCTDSTAFNYDGLATCDDGSCIPFVYGCTDSVANNYDITANTDDGSCTYQMTYVPDDNFEQALINLGYDNALDDSVLTSSINTVTYLDVSSKNIADLTGIEDFSDLADLACYGNQLTTLDLSNNTLLQYLSCVGNQLTSIDISQNINLISLQCHDNLLNTLDISNNLFLIQLTCGYNQLTILDVSNNTALSTLMCSSNPLTSLDVSNNTSLTDLSCFSTGITTLDVSQNTALTVLGCYSNQLTNLDVSGATALTFLDCDQNQLTSLDVSNNTDLWGLYCSNNQLTSLDLSSHTTLTQLYCQNNQLTSLDVRNGNNQALNNYDYNSTNNPNLTCISVDDSNWSDSNWTNIDPWASFSANCATALGCTDSTAFNYDISADTDDGSCLYCDLSIVAHSLNSTTALACDGFAFVSSTSNYPITSYNWENSSGNSLSTASSASNLCDDIYTLTVVDSVGCIAVDSFVIGDLYGCTDTLAINYNAFANIDDGSCIAVTYGCTDSLAFNYDISANTDDGSCIALVFGCTDSLAFNYDISANTDDGSCIAIVLGCTDSLAFNYNALVNIDDGSCIAVTYGCTDSLAFNYDISANTDDGSCGYCDLTFSILQIAINTNNTLCNGWVYTSTYSSHTPILNSWNTGSSLSYITNACAGSYTLTVTDSIGCTIDTSIIIETTIYGCTDPTAFNYDVSANTDDGSCIAVVLGCTDSLVFNYDVLANTDDGSCIYQMTYVPDDNFEQALINLGYDNVLDDSVRTASIDTVTNLNVGYQTISDLTGIEYFSSLNELSCYGNQLTSLDVSNNAVLQKLYCWNNQLTSLDVSNNPALTNLRCQSNQLTSLDVSNNASLTDFLSHYNQLTSLDIRNGNNINTSFTASNNPNLYCIDVDNAAWSTANWTNIDFGTSFSENCSLAGCVDSLACNYNSLAWIDDGSCILPDGCTDPVACNYDSLATCDDGSCSGLLGCIDVTACNYDSLATCDDGSCAYATTSTTTVIACDSVVWNGTTYDSSGAYPYSGSNSNLIYSEDFENFIDLEWNTTSTINYNNTMILGNFGDSTVSLGLSSLPSHDSIRVEFDLYILDTWDGNGTSNGIGLPYEPDLWSLKLDGIDVINTTFSHSTVNNQSYPDNYPASYPYYTGAYQDSMPNVCWPPASNFSGLYKINRIYNHSNSTLSLDFVGDPEQGICDESWALDNVKVYLYSNNTLTNANGCDSTAILNLTIAVCGCTDSAANNYNPLATLDDSSCCYINITTTSTNIDCYGYDNGEAFAVAQGGTEPYTFSWDTGTWSGDTVTTLTPGLHTVIVTDTRGCTASDTILTHQPSELSSLVNLYLYQNVLCFGDSTGVAYVNVVGGTLPYSYQWDNVTANNSVGDTGQAAVGLWVGTHTVTLTDANGCILTDSIIIQSNQDTSYTNITACDSLVWNGITYNLSGNYNYLTTNVNGCDSTAVLNLTINNSVSTSNSQSICAGNSITVGTSIYNASGTYTDVLIDVNGCDSTVTTTLTVNPIGCTDSSACNYDANAICDDGSCLTIYGCTDSTAFNYHVNAVCDDGSCIPFVYGCIDVLAFNYDVSANTDDGSCIPIALGCTDSLAFNYDVLANTDDGSCIAVVLGCIDSTQFNYYVLGNTDNGSCIPFIYGCTDSLAFNYDISANTDDGSCIAVALGCTDSLAFNYDVSANTDDGSCITVVNGCTDSAAFNYNVSADTDDGSCLYCDLSIVAHSLNSTTALACDGFAFVSSTSNYPITSYNWENSSGNSLSTASFASNLCDDIYTLTVVDSVGCIAVDSFVIGDLYGCTDMLAINYNAFANIDDSSCCFIYGCTDINAFNYSSNACMDDNSCCYISGCTDSTAINYVSIACFDNGGCIPYIYGCTDVLAFNYDISANTDDGSCIPVALGCTDSLAFNYNSNANTDDGSCIPYIYGCTDSLAFNYDISANTDDGSCIAVVLGCTDSLAFNYDVSANMDDGSCGYCDLTFSIAQIAPNTNNTLCNGWIYTSTYSSYTPITYLWSTGNTQDYILGLCAGTYSLTVTDTVGCTIDTSIIIETTIYGCTDPTAFNYDVSANTDDGSCITVVLGCTDSTAFNYDVSANTDNGSCIVVVFGCTDSLAFNYDISANTDDGSCIAKVLGCTDSLAFNYDVLANTDDGSCIAVVLGCTDSTAFNYDISANTDDGACIAVVLGCTDSLAFNYDISANTNDGSCVAIVNGCTDSLAFNYDVLANTDDGSCIAVVLGCIDSTQFNYNVLGNTDNGSCIPFIYGCTDSLAFNYDISANTDDGACIAVVLGCTDSLAFNYDVSANTDDGSCGYCDLTFSIAQIAPNTNNTLCNGWIYTSTYSSHTPILNSWNTGSSLSYITNACTGSYTLTVTDSVGCTIDTSIIMETNIYGCTDSSFCNYNPNASIDNGSCYLIVGCTNPLAFNYDSTACLDDGSCMPYIYGCTDTLACDFNPYANIDNGSCLTAYGCTDDMYCNYDSSATCDDGSCVGILGCTDPTACNYYPLAACDDGNCIGLLGCMNPTACNYDPATTCDDGSCLIVYGCTDITALNYDSNAVCDDGLCIPFVYGCMDSTAVNYNSLANTDDTSCIATVLGCMDSIAFNYDSLANTDDGSCGYCDLIFSSFQTTQNTNNNCNGWVFAFASSSYPPTTYLWSTGSTQNYIVTLCTETYSLTVTDSAGCSIDTLLVIGTPPIFGCTDPASFNYDVSANTDDGSCLYCDLSVNVLSSLDSACNGVAFVSSSSSSYPPITYLWSTGSTQDNIIGLCAGIYSLTVTDAVGCTVQESITIGTPVIDGCTDPAALNYNTLANNDDGSCEYLLTYVPDDFFEAYLEANGMGDGIPFNDSVLTSNINTVTQLSCNSTYIADLTGIEDFTALTFLTCQNNQLTSLDISQNTALIYLYCGNNQLTSLDVSQNNALTTLYCDNNQLTSLDVRNGYNINLNSWNSTNNPNLYCIDVDNITIATALFTNIDPWANFNTNCATAFGCTDSTAANYNALATIDDSSCIYNIYGCTDSTATNYDPLATIDDGSCTYPNTCGAITGVNMSDIIHDRATFNWDNMNSATCQVDQIRIRYREVGTNAYSTKTMGTPVGSGCNTTNTSKLVLGLTPSTTYEYDFKIWYCNASTVTWHANGSFTTLPICDNVTNVIPTPITTTKTTFCWDTVSTYSFVRLKYREDVPGSSFSNIGGMGVHSPTLCKDKNGLTPGLTYRVMWRAWCNPSGGPYRSPQWDGPVTWTQPTSIRLEGGTTIANLEVYPNPSRDVFNISFTSETQQNLKVRVLNVVGEILIDEDLQQFIGEYTKAIDLATYTKGIYFLEIETGDGVINKKLILQ